MSEICVRLGQSDMRAQEWLLLRPENRVAPEVEAFPRPSKRPDGSYIYDKVPNHAQDLSPPSASAGAAATTTSGRQQMFYKKRAYEEKPVIEGPSAPAKLGRSGGSGTQTRTYSVNQVAPKGKIAMLTRVPGGQKTVISWQDAPDDLFYKATAQTKKVSPLCIVV